MKLLLSLLLLYIIYILNINAILINSKYKGALNIGLLNHVDNQLESISFDKSDADLYFTQKLDHFNSQNNKTFQQRYMINTTFANLNDNPPVFLILGGEGPISPAYLTGHFIVTSYAEQFGAIVVVLEHRYYGESVPTPDTSTPNLQWLSSEQALADASNFKDFISQKYNTGKWISFGGSYSGSLSAWLRQRYPWQFAGAIGSSGPVLAQSDFIEYLQVVGRSIRTRGGDSCYNTFGSASKTVTTLLKSSTGLQQLSKMFNTCTPLSDNQLDQQLFVQNLVDGPSGVVQYNMDNVNYQPFNITKMCEIIQSKSSPLDGFAYLTAMFNNNNCMSIDFNEYVKEMQQTSAGRSWVYQTCREFGFYQTAEDTSSQPFPALLPLNFSLYQCQAIFGENIRQPNTDFTNRNYGEKDLKVENVAMMYGSIDPWHMLGTCDESKLGEGRILGDNSYTYLINGTAHCADLYQPREIDEPDLTKARSISLALITIWLNS